MQISHPQDATTLIGRSFLHRQDAPTEPMGVRSVSWSPGSPVPAPTEEELAWSEQGLPDDPCDAPTEELDRAALLRIMADDPWFHTRASPGWEPQVRARSRLDSAARAGLLLIAAWLPVAALLMAS